MAAQGGQLLGIVPNNVLKRALGLDYIGTISDDNIPWQGLEH
jgi:hypothetical protein